MTALTKLVATEFSLCFFRFQEIPHQKWCLIATPLLKYLVFLKASDSGLQYATAVKKLLLLFIVELAPSFVPKGQVRFLKGVIQVS